jgi:hypothetical protein
MKGIVAIAALLAALFVFVPAYAQKSPPPDEKTKLCHHCDWLAIQISDIDEKIASWQRQIASIHKYSNLADPNIQNALKDIDSTIARLNAKKQALQAELEKCKKRCAELTSAATTPQTPGGSSTGGYKGGPTSTGGTGTGGTATGGKEGGGKAAGGETPGGGANTTPVTPQGEPPCPPKKPSAPVVPGHGNADGIYVPPSINPKPPLPQKGSLSRAEWDHLFDHMAEADFFGDHMDIADVLDHLSDLIDDAYDDLAKDPEDQDAEERLGWLRKQQDFYRRWDARFHVHFKRILAGEADCPPPVIYMMPLRKYLKASSPTEDSPFYNPGGGAYTPYGSTKKKKPDEGEGYIPYGTGEPDRQPSNGTNAPDNVPGPKNAPYGQGQNGPP